MKEGYPTTLRISLKDGPQLSYIRDGFWKAGWDREGGKGGKDDSRGDREEENDE